MLFLATKRVAGTTERCMEWAQKVMYHLRNMIVAQVGIKEVTEDIAKNQYEKIRRQMKGLGHKMECMFS
jgi:hypothetical protein